MKKNKKGMTLTEVIIAMTIFGIMSAAIITALYISVQYTQRSRMRDTELAQQTEGVGKLDDTRLTQVGTDKFNIEFSNLTVPSDPIKNTQVTLYSANDVQFGSRFGFNVKTFTDGTLSSPSTTVDPTAGDEYKFFIQNNSAEDVTLIVNVSGGHIFEVANNSATGYLHTSDRYTRTIPKGSFVEFGYENAAPDATSLFFNYVNTSGVTIKADYVDFASFPSSMEQSIVLN